MWLLVQNIAPIHYNSAWARYFDRCQLQSGASAVCSRGESCASEDRFPLLNDRFSPRFRLVSGFEAFRSPGLELEVTKGGRGIGRLAGKS